MVNKLMLKHMESKKGSSLVTVLVITAVLVILGTVLADSMMIRHKNAKSDAYSQYAYIAAETSVERCMYKLDQLSRDASVVNGLTYRYNLQEYAEDIVNELRNHLDTAYDDIDVLGDSAEKASAELSVTRVSQQLTGNSRITVTIGVSAKASVSSGLFASNQRMVYAQRNFTFPINERIWLNEAICSLGDVIASGSSPYIRGNINVYGTSPEKKRQPEQQYYGGVYAKNGASLFMIDGDVYTRGFIRTGEYGADAVGSGIHITGDAVAQCIQAFGRDDNIVLYHNAYTFDDLEVDGENALIAVRGSYIGLSRGEMLHDESSAVINAAPIHSLSSEASKKSRIVINGDIIIRGETMKIDPSGEGTDKLENASVAWWEGENRPAYRAFSDYKDSGGTLDYTQWLKNDRDRMRGFLNLFQVWSPYTVDIGAWLEDINRARQSPENTLSGVSLSFPEQIRGFCNYTMSANNRVYFMDNTREAVQTGEIGIRRISQDLKTHGSIQAIPIPQDENGSSVSWEDFWGGIVEADWGIKYYNLIDRRVEKLKEMLLEVTHKFAVRSLGQVGDLNFKNEFKGAPEDVNGSKNLFQYLEKSLDARFPASNTNPQVIRCEDNGIHEASATGISIDAAAAAAGRTIRDDAYYLIINFDPDRVLQVTRSFKGIIFSMGRVEIGKGAHIEGAVVAAGRGYDPDPWKNYAGGSAAGYYTSDGGTEIPRIPVIKQDGENQEAFENGEYAAVLFKSTLGDASAAEPSIRFPGRNELLEALEAYSVDLYDIF